MFICFALSNIIKISCDDDIKKTFEQKLIEEGERSELGYLGVLRELLSQLWNGKYSEPDYMTEEGFVKIANKEIYDRFNENLKKEYDAGVSPVKFKNYMLEFGFSDSLNRRKLEVPLPNKPDKKSRLCDIFTPRVIRKLGIEPVEKTETEKLEEIRNWILNNQKDDNISASSLDAKIKEAGFEPEKILEKFRIEGFLTKTSLDAWGVVKP